jgi:hypothetical protein
MGGQVGEGGTLQTDAAQLYVFLPTPAKAKKLGLLSIYIFSLSVVQVVGNYYYTVYFTPVYIHTGDIFLLTVLYCFGVRGFSFFLSFSRNTVISFQQCYSYMEHTET